ncbi:MAG TPA: serine hydrolase [Candidatus Methanoperedenaceae archaeon]|nr:serine hydrolase [Candidatus Methanoperedenaceae archaeon]
MAVLALLIVLFIPQLQSPEKSSKPEYWPTLGWRNGTPEEHGFNSSGLADALLTMRERNINIHSLLVIRNGEVVVDAYFYPYNGTTVHDQASVTKSVMTTLIAIAADQGKLKLDEPMVSFFPDRIILNRDARKESITVRHLASMSSGLDCTSERDEATLNEMMASPDWVQFTLDRKVVWEPGTHFVYCSPGLHLLSPILQNATGMTALEFGRRNLFEPLGIRDVIWTTDPQGYNVGSAELFLHPHDMAKIGYLWLNKGQWEDGQVVSRDWVEKSVMAQIDTGGDDDYGYGWWVPESDPALYSAIGRGGQRIIVVPEWNLIVVTTGGGFDFDEIEPLLTATIMDMGKTLPANQEGMAKLEAALNIISQPPAPRQAAPLPQKANISGKTFIFEPNTLKVEKLRIDFNGSEEAVLNITLTGRGQMPPRPVGLDGVYRLSKGDYNLPLGQRGYWADADTFVLEYDEIARNIHFIIRMHIEGDRAVVEALQTAHEIGAKFEGRLEE